MLTPFSPQRLASLALACSLLIAPFALPAWAQEQRSRLLTVTGTGVQTIPTTITRVRLAVEVRGEDAAVVQREVARQTAQVISLLRSQGVERLQTTGLSLQPRYESRDDQREPRLVGYIGSNSVAFRIATDAAGDLIDQAVGTGVTRIDGVEFLATDAAIEAARAEALRQATANARAEAAIVLTSLGLREQEITGIQINSAGGDFNPRIQANTMAFESADAIVGGDQTVRASVTLEIRY